MIKEKCIWRKKGICSSDKLEFCPSDCSLGNLEFKKKAIQKRIKEEEEIVHKLKIRSMWRKRGEIKDRIAGICILSKTLKDYFNSSHKNTPGTG